MSNLTAPVVDVVTLARDAVKALLAAHPLTSATNQHSWQERDAAASPCYIVHATLASWELGTAQRGVARINMLVRAKIQADAKVVAARLDPVQRLYTVLFEETEGGALWTRLNALTTAHFWPWTSPAMKAEGSIDGRHFATEYTWQMKAQRVKPANL